MSQKLDLICFVSFKILYFPSDFRLQWIGIRRIRESTLRPSKQLFGDGNIHMTATFLNQMRILSLIIVPFGLTGGYTQNFD